MSCENGLAIERITEELWLNETRNGNAATRQELEDSLAGYLEEEWLSNRNNHRKES